MKQSLTFKTVLIALLLEIICSTVKAETIDYTIDDFTFWLDTETQETVLSRYRGSATEVVVPEEATYKEKIYKVTRLGNYCFSGCFSLTAIDIPYSVTSLGDYCFRNCTSLTAIEIPASVTSLGDRCFRYCTSLTAIEIPASVTSLGDYCFLNCYSLKTVICKMENVVNDFSLFVGTPIEEATLYVPRHLLDTYKSTYPWNGFGSILPLTETGINDIQEAGISFRSVNGNVVMSGLADGTSVSYYSAEGRLLGKSMIDGGTASFSAKPNTFVIVKIGKQSIKVGVK